MKEHSKHKIKKDKKKRKRVLNYIREYHIHDIVRQYNRIDDGTCEIVGFSNDSDYLVLLYYSYE
jgi:hypothetical protein